MSLVPLQYFPGIIWFVSQKRLGAAAGERGGRPPEALSAHPLPTCAAPSAALPFYGGSLKRAALRRPHSTPVSSCPLLSSKAKAHEVLTSGVRDYHVLSLTVKRAVYSFNC